MVQEIEKRLIRFHLGIVKITRPICKDTLLTHVSNQIVRSSLSSALNFGEVRAAESSNDFAHKLKVVLKELRETLIGLVILDEGGFTKNNVLLKSLIEENNELISIFVTSINTHKRNQSEKLNKTRKHNKS